MVEGEAQKKEVKYYNRDFEYSEHKEEMGKYIEKLREEGGLEVEGGKG